MGRSEEPAQIPPAELARKNRPTAPPPSRVRKYSNDSVSAASVAADAPTTPEPAHQYTAPLPAPFPWVSSSFSNAAAAPSMAGRSAAGLSHGKGAALNTSHPSSHPQSHFDV